MLNAYMVVMYNLSKLVSVFVFVMFFQFLLKRIFYQDYEMSFFSIPSVFKSEPRSIIFLFSF